MSDEVETAIRPETIRQRLRRLGHIVNHVRHLDAVDRRWLRSWLLDSQVERDLLDDELRRGER